MGTCCRRALFVAENTPINTFQAGSENQGESPGPNVSSLQGEVVVFFF